MDQPVQETDSDEREAAPERPSSEPTPSAWRFRLTVLKYHRLVYRVCYGLLGDAHEAEDVTQEAFLRYWQHASHVRGAKAWLVTVARNKCLDRLRSGKRLVSLEPELAENQADDRDPEWHASQAELGERLDRLVGELPEPQKSLVLLFDVQGLTGAECAEVLGLNVNQVKVYLHRARRRLRRALEDGRD